MRGALTWIVPYLTVVSDRLSDAAQQTRKRVIISFFAPLFPIFLSPDFTEPILI